MRLLQVDIAVVTAGITTSGIAVIALEITGMTAIYTRQGIVEKVKMTLKHLIGVIVKIRVEERIILMITDQRNDPDMTTRTGIVGAEAEAEA